MQPHPEVDRDTQMIGWQPVFATSRPATSFSNQNLMPILGLGAAVLCIAAAGGVLFKQHQDMNSQKTIWQQQAITQERTRIIKCVQAPAP